MEQSVFYQRFRTEAESLGHDAAAVRRLSSEAVRRMAGAGAEEATGTFLENMKRRLAGELRAEARQATTAWIGEMVRGRFAGAKVRMPDDRIAVIYLDGFEAFDEERA